jgi:hypothetical protein
MHSSTSELERGAGRPSKDGYRTKDNKRVPSVTTILGRFKEAGGLMHWAWTLGTEGKDYRKERDDAANAGSLAHDMIEAAVHGTDFTIPPELPDDVVERAVTAARNFHVWREQTQLRIVATEVPLVSERHRFGGTIDAVGHVMGSPELYIIDWKSSNAIYGDYIAQVASYAALWEECRGEAIAGVHLLRVDKEFAGFHHHQWGRAVLDVGLRYFLHCREAYDLAATLKKAAA